MPLVAAPTPIRHHGVGRPGLPVRAFSLLWINAFNVEFQHVNVLDGCDEVIGKGVVLVGFTSNGLIGESLRSLRCAFRNEFAGTNAPIAFDDEILVGGCDAFHYRFVDGDKTNRANGGDQVVQAVFIACLSLILRAAIIGLLA